MIVKALEILLSEREIKETVQLMEDILRSNIKWTNADVVKQFENNMKKIYNTNHAIAVSTGSTAIESVLVALGVDSNFIVYCPVLTAPPTIISSLCTGAKIVYVDSLKEDFGMNPVDLENKIKLFGSKGVIIPVHIGGIISKKIYDIVKIGEKYNLPVVEDCAHAHGSMLNNKYAGTFGIAGTYSYFLTKTLTSGEGGIIITNSNDIDEKVRMIRNYGKDKQGSHIIKGSSWRMNEFTAAVALVQTQYQDDIVNIKMEIAEKYDEFFKNYEDFTIYKTQAFNGYYKYILGVNKEVDLKKIENILKNQFNISLPARVYDNLCNEEPYLKNHKNILNSDSPFPNATFLKMHHLCLPIYRGLSQEEIDYVCTSLINVVENEVGL